MLSTRWAGIVCRPRRLRASRLRCRDQFLTVVDQHRAGESVLAMLAQWPLRALLHETARRYLPAIFDVSLHSFRAGSRKTRPARVRWSLKLGIELGRASSGERGQRAVAQG